MAIVGMPGSGKTQTSSYLKSRGFPVVSLGSIILEEVARRGLEITPANERDVREDLRRKQGMDVCAIRSLPQIRQEIAGSSLVVIDGLYSWSEYKTFRTEFADDLVVLAVCAPRTLRYSRLASRPFRPLNDSEAMYRDLQEIETIEKGGPIAMADLFVINDGSIDGLYSQIDTLLDSLLRQDS